MGNTKKTLPEDIVQELYFSEKEYSQDQIKIAEEIIANAKSGMYHDFESELAAPKMALHQDLLAAGLIDIDNKMQNGDYDEPPTSEQQEELMDLLKKII